MKREIPSQLCNPYFRFFLVARNGKIPIEPKFNTDNCYMFFEPKLLNHLLRGGNVGVICGYGGLIVIDFDEVDYQFQKANLLPKTFTCKSAGKGLKHFYYILKGDMIKKKGLDACKMCKNPILISNTEKRENLVWKFCEGCKEWGIPDRMVDIQAGNYPLTCPPSIINRKSYDVVNDVSIAEIEYETLSRVFEINLLKKHLKGEINYEPSPEKVQQMIDILLNLKVERKGKTRFACPFHESNGSGNLAVLPDGKSYCHHCNRTFSNPLNFKKYFVGEIYKYLQFGIFLLINFWNLSSISSIKNKFFGDLKKFKVDAIAQGDDPYRVLYKFFGNPG